MDGSDLIVPTGVGKQVRQFLSEKDQISVHLADNGILDYKGTIPLYDYQKEAVEAMRTYQLRDLTEPLRIRKDTDGHCPGCELGRKVLWVTHTQDLLIQSKTRAEQYFSPETLGTITAGKAQVGSHMTFATVQTLCKMDLGQFRYTWDVVIVDECHRWPVHQRR